ncbi:MAG: DUF4147 domain-containing protein [Pseudomonadota bacterium]
MANSAQPQHARARQHLLDFFAAGVNAVKGDAAVVRYFATAPKPERCHAIAIGKAASAMMHGAFQSLPDAIESALLITKHDHFDTALNDSGVPLQAIESSHPVPGDDSVNAGQRLLAFIDSTPADAHLLFLISGGTSSLVEVLPEGMTLSDLQSLNDQLLATGMDIGDMNRVRKSVSRIKGGRLAGYLGARTATCLLVSDVPGDKLADIGSGPLIRESANVPDSLPESLKPFVQPALNDAVSSDVWSRIDCHIVASLAHAKAAAKDAARAAGFTVDVDDSFLDGDASKAGLRVAEELQTAAPGVMIWGGETTMVLPDNPGRGGRNQHLALAAAQAIAGQDGYYLLCAGTDGSDGPTRDAGGLVDGNTVERGSVAGVSALAAMHAADSGNFLAAADALVTTGPTGTNVMDLVIGLKL